MAVLALWCLVFRMGDSLEASRVGWKIKTRREDNTITSVGEQFE